MDNIVIIYIIRITTDFIVSGIAPFKDMMLLLAYTNADMHQHEETDDPEKQKRQVIMRNLYWDYFDHCFYLFYVLTY